MRREGVESREERVEMWEVKVVKRDSSLVTRDSSLHHLIQGIRAGSCNRIFWIEKDGGQMGWGRLVLSF